MLITLLSNKHKKQKKDDANYKVSVYTFKKQIRSILWQMILHSK